MRAFVIIGLALLCNAAEAQQPWTLGQCVKRAEAKNLTVRDATLNAELANEGRYQSRWALLPDLNAGATHGYNWGKAVDRYTNTFATDRVRTDNLYLASNWTLFEGLRRQNEFKQSSLNADAEQQAVNASLNNVRATVVDQFLNVLSLRERIKSTDAQAAITREQLERMKLLVEAGRNARADLLDLSAQVAQDELSLAELNNQSDQAMLLLEQSLQLTPEEMRGFDITAPAVTALTITEPTATIESIVDKVLSTDPAFAEAQLRTQSAERGISIAKSGSIPSLSFNASVSSGYSGSNTEAVGAPIYGDPLPIGVTGSGETVYTDNVSYNTQVRSFNDQLDDNLNKSTSFTLSVPIFNNMRNRYSIQQARIQHEQALVNVDREHDRVLRDVQDALVQQRSAFRKYNAASRAVEAGDASLSYAQERFTQGSITVLELNTAKANLAKSTADLIDAKYSWLKAAKLLDILQGLPVSL